MMISSTIFILTIPKIAFGIVLKERNQWQNSALQLGSCLWPLNPLIFGVLCIPIGLLEFDNVTHKAHVKHAQALEFAKDTYERKN